MLIIEDIQSKARWLYGSDTWKYIARALMSDGTLSMLIFRCMVFFNAFLITKPIAAILCKLNAICCGAVIGRSASFGKGFVILHSVGVVINSKVRGGEDIVIESGVVLGEEKRGCPVLGSHIFIGSGAKIFGATTVGDNVTIGANAVVNKSVANNLVVGGVPARVLGYKSDLIG